MSQPQNNQDKDLEKIDQDINTHRRFVKYLIVIIVLSYIAFSSNELSLSTTLQTWGTFGDFFGGILNPIFALFAFYWLTYSVRLQIKELKETRQELEKAAKAQEESAKHQEEIARLEGENVKTQEKILDLNKDTLKSQQIAANAQQEQIAIQNFESLFFQLLKTKTDVTNEILVGSRGTLQKFATYKIGYAENKILEMMNKGNKVSGKESIKDHLILFKSYVNDNWENFYTASFLDIAGSYFRLNYQIVKLINENNTLNSYEKVLGKDYSAKQKEYFDIFRATFTQYELEAFFFNCLYKYGNGRFKGMLEKYGMFEPLLIDYDRSSEWLHALTRYAYKYEKIIFEQNDLWNEYFEKIEKIKKIDRNILKYNMLKLYDLCLFKMPENLMPYNHEHKQKFDILDVDKKVKFITNCIDQSKRLNFKEEFYQQVVWEESELLRKYKKLDEDLSERDRDLWLREITESEERLKNINSVQHIDEIQFILSSRIVVDDFFEYFELKGK